MTQSSQLDADVIIIGAGPVGMLLAYQLDRLGIHCFIIDQNLTTTKWPKMDLTNCRSMEILRTLGLADDYRAQENAVGPDAQFDSIFVTNLAEGGHLLGSWREYIKQCNDGTQPAEPGQRCSQIIFEAWMRNIITTKPRVTMKMGWKYVEHIEQSHGVIAAIVDRMGQSHTLRGRYLVGCDGGGSKVRKSAGIKMIGGQIPIRFYLVHFRSKQLAEQLPFGHFWHAFVAKSGFLISQDDKDTFTAHCPIEEEKGGNIDPKEIVYRALGGIKGRSEIVIDEILVHSEWRPSFSVAEKYLTDNGRVFLAGDAAHRNPPHGGYGMNSGVVDAIDLGWRLAAVIKGYGGRLLLESYEKERRPMMIRALQRSHRHVMEHVILDQIYHDSWEYLDSISCDGEKARATIHQYIDVSGSEILDRGIELDLRYDSPVIFQDDTPALPWDVKKYQPSTRPGSRAPHLFLNDGVTSTYDLFGEEWTLFHFISNSNEKPQENTNGFSTVAEKLAFPLRVVTLQNEDHARKVWERDLVLVRPDTHVAWRANIAPTSDAEIQHIFGVVSGNRCFPEYTEGEHDDDGFSELVVKFTKNSLDNEVTIAGENSLR